MKKYLVFLFFMLAPLMGHAQGSSIPATNYLAGAVPEVDGRVAFSKDFFVEGYSQQDFYDKLQGWLTDKLYKLKDPASRIVYTDSTKSILIALCSEWIVFSSTALELDRTRIHYQLSINCGKNKCSLRVTKINYDYQGNKYKAEEWISDAVALNKSKTKLSRGLAKWRRKTIDYMNQLFDDAAFALGTATIKKENLGERALIAPQHVVIQEENSLTDIPGYEQLVVDKLKARTFSTTEGRLVLSTGTDDYNMSIITANEGGELIVKDGTATVECNFASNQPIVPFREATHFMLKYYPKESKSPLLIYECKRDKAMQGQEKMNQVKGEIIKGWMLK